MTTTVHKNPTQAGQQITQDNDHWGTTLGAAAGPISFGFQTSIVGYSVSGENISNFSPLSASEQAAARAALGFWASIANITFTDLGNSNTATIEFSNYSNPNDGAAAFAYFPGSTAVGNRSGDVFINTWFTSTTNDSPGTYAFLTFIHEIGHALGLEHPGSYNAGPGVSITYQNNAEYVEDSRQYSVMSYFSETNTGANYFGIYPETPMLDDITAIQRLYGANATTRTGNTTYGFNSNAGSAYNIASSTQKAVFTVWDAGGTDTFDFSGYSQSQTIDLIAASFSNVGGLIDNVAIAQGVTIENAIGGSGSDTIIGNDADNVLIGGAGDDTIDGGAGTNSAVFSGVRSAYTLTALSGNGVRVSGPDGTDTLTNIEKLVFADQTIGWPHVAPTVSVVASVSVLENQSIAAILLITSISNPSGDAIAQYVFSDQGGGAGYFTSNGVAIPDGQWIYPADANSVSYVGGSLPSSDTLMVGIYDYTTSAYVYGTAITAITTPTVGNGQIQNNNFGQTSLNVVVLNGGQQDIAAGGTANATTIYGGGYQIIYGSASGTIVSGGAAVVYAGGTTSGTTINGGQEYVGAGGHDSNAVVRSAGVLNIAAGGTASAATVSSGGTLLDFGAASGAVLSSGGGAYISAGGVAVGTTVHGGAADIVLLGGVASATSLVGGVEVVSGTTVATRVGSGSLEYVATGSATAAVVSNGGTMTVTTGGTTNGATISAGGTLIDFGTVSGTVLDSGGGAYISAGGVAVGTTVRGGAADIVQFGGTASGTIVGGVEAVFGTTVGARVASGGLEYVAAGGLVSAVVISGGTLEVASGGSTGASAVTFAAGGGGILQLDNAQAFNGKVSGFGVLDYLDLRDIAFGSNTTLGFTEAAGNTSGTLRVSDGSRTANITLLGQYVTGQLGMGSDGAGGTFIAAPQVVAQAEPNANGLVTTHQV